METAFLVLVKLQVMNKASGSVKEDVRLEIPLQVQKKNKVEHICNCISQLFTELNLRFLFCSSGYSHCLTLELTDMFTKCAVLIRQTLKSMATSNYKF